MGNEWTIVSHLDVRFMSSLSVFIFPKRMKEWVWLVQKSHINAYSFEISEIHFFEMTEISFFFETKTMPVRATGYKYSSTSTCDLSVNNNAIV